MEEINRAFREYLTERIFCENDCLEDRDEMNNLLGCWDTAVGFFTIIAPTSITHPSIIGYT